MSYVVNYGEIETNKPITKEVKEIIESILEEEDVCDIDEYVIEINECYDKWFDETISKVIEKVAPLGYVLNGTVEYMGDWEGRIVIKNNSVGELSRELAAVADAGDEELIAELKNRGYTVSEITKETIEKALQCLIDNGIEDNEAETVLQALGYVLMDAELFPEEE